MTRSKVLHKVIKTLHKRTRTILGCKMCASVQRKPMEAFQRLCRHEVTAVGTYKGLYLVVLSHWLQRGFRLGCDRSLFDLVC